MKIIRLLEELCRELRTFNENVECLSLIEKELLRRRNNPLIAMSNLEIDNLKIWINRILKKREITLEGQPWQIKNAERFLEGYGHNRTATKYTRELISKALGFDSFDDLLEAWRREKAGKGAVAGDGGGVSGAASERRAG